MKALLIILAVQLFIFFWQAISVKGKDAKQHRAEYMFIGLNAMIFSAVLLVTVITAIVKYVG